MSKNKTKFQKIAADFLDAEKVIKKELPKPRKAVTALVEFIKQYSINPYQICVEIYKMYHLNKNRYPDINVIEKIKEDLKRLNELQKNPQLILF